MQMLECVGGGLGCAFFAGDGRCFVVGVAWGWEEAGDVTDSFRDISSESRKWY